MVDLRALRCEIDAIDEQMLRLLAKRVEVCQVVGLSKKVEGLPVRDAKREEEVFSLVRKNAARLGLNPIRVEAVYREIVNMCSAVQK
jgi:chorismate mutase